MGDIMKGIEFLGVPTTVAIIIIGLFLIMNIIGEIAEWTGKVVPEFLKVRKYFKRKKDEKIEQQERLKRVDEKFAAFEMHYNPENIAKRDKWMDWVNDRTDKYDESIDKLTKGLDAIVEALTKNTEMTEEMFIQDSRTIILSFAEKAAQKDLVVSREEFNRVFKVYNKYEQFLEDHNKTNGEVDIAIKVIQDGYKFRLQNHLFFEDLRGSNN